MGLALCQTSLQIKQADKNAKNKIWTAKHNSLFFEFMFHLISMLL